MQSNIYGKVSIEEMTKHIKDYIQSDSKYEYQICVGCDSQNTNLTKIVVVVAVIRVGKGGIYFYEISKERIITNLQQKIYHETAMSLEIASKISNCFADNDIEQEVEIHVDIGTNKEKGKTCPLVQEIVNWVQGSGFKCSYKPQSYAASCIANRISK